MTIIEYIGSIGGIGGVFALLMFLVYRQTIKQMRDDRKYMEDHLSNIIQDYNTITNELIIWLKSKNGSN